MKSILEEAAEITAGNRRADYGHPYDNHGLTGKLWASYLGLNSPLTGEQVCAMNILQKISRSAASGKATRDTWVDVAGFAQNANECTAEGERRKPK